MRIGFCCNGQRKERMHWSLKTDINSQSPRSRRRRRRRRRRIQNFAVRKLSSNLRPCDPILIPSYLGCSCCCCFERRRLNDPLLARQCRQCSSRGLTTMTSTPSLRRCCSGSSIRPKESAINLHNSGGGEGDEEQQQQQQQKQQQHRSTRMLLLLLMGCSSSFT